jgi:hypothetical protein
MLLIQLTLLAVIKMLERKVDTCRYDLSTMTVGLQLLFHIPSQLQGSALYGDSTDLRGRNEVSEVGGRSEDFTCNLNFNVKNLPDV